MTPVITPAWAACPNGPELSPSQVDIWRIRLDGDGPAPANRNTARHALRDILARYLRCSMEDLRIARHPGGKPYLEIPDQPLQFNLSHARDLALVAVSRNRPVGIDVESRRDINDPLRLARRAFSATDLARLEAAGQAERFDLFFALWTCLEARQKAHGQGIFAPRVDPATLVCTRFMPTDRHAAAVCGVNTGEDWQARFFDYEPDSP